MTIWELCRRDRDVTVDGFLVNPVAKGNRAECRYGHIELESPPFDQHSELPERDRGNKYLVVIERLVDRGHRTAAKLLVTHEVTNEYVRIEQDHLLASHVTSIGSVMSPRPTMRPLKRPKPERTRVRTGAS